MPSDPTRPGGLRYTRAQRRLLTAVAGLIVAALAGGAYALTYDVLRELALAGRVSDRWAPLYPAMADTLTAMTILSLVITRNARWWTRLLRWTLLLLLVAGGAALSVQHSVWGYSDLPVDPLRAGVAVAPHVMLVIAVWLWLTMFKQIRVARPAAEEIETVDTQRGHVKVLEPAAPEPLALEAPSEPEGEREPEPESPLAFLDDPEPEPLIPFAPQNPEPAHTAQEAGASAPDPRTHDQSLSSEPPPLDTLPEPRPPLDSLPDPLPDPQSAAPTLLPTDVELVRSRDRDDAEERPVAATTRPDIVMPAYGGDEDEHDTPPTDRAEDPDGGDRPDVQDVQAIEDGQDGGDGDGDDGDRTVRDVNPPPSGSFRSGPTPPAD